MKNQFEFFSIGCITDRDCAYNISMLDPGAAKLLGIRSYPFNFQECRLLSDGSSPNVDDASMNGCLCSNYITGAQVIVNHGHGAGVASNGANNNVYVTCTKVDGGSVFFFVIQALLSFAFFSLGVRCLLIILAHLRYIYDHILYQFSKLLGPTTTSKRLRSSLMRLHALICLFYLSLSCIFLATHKACMIYSFKTGIPDLASPPGEQLHPVEYSLNRLYMMGFTMQGLCGLHFSILWLSSTPKIFTVATHSHTRTTYFRPLWYKRFIYLAELMVILPILALISNPTSDIFIVQAIAGIILVYEFTIGCKNISRILRFIASRAVNHPPADTQTNSNANHNPKPSSPVEDEAVAAKKLNDIADRIDFLSKRLKIFGSVCIILNLLMVILFEFLRLYLSTETFLNPRAIGNELGDLSFFLISVIFFNFLQESVKSSRDPECKHKYPFKKKIKRNKSKDIPDEKPLQKPQIPEAEKIIVIEETPLDATSDPKTVGVDMSRLVL